MRIRFGKTPLNIPIILAAGCTGYGLDVLKIVDLRYIGGIIPKTITLFPQEGNPPPRIVEVYAGLLNNIGLENVGIQRFLEEKLAPLRNLNIAVIVSIAGKSEEEFLRLCEYLNNSSTIAAVELNLSCPNVEGIIYATCPTLTYDVIKVVRDHLNSLPLIAKLSYSNYVAEIAQAACDAGAEILSLINSVPAACRIGERIFKGGLSGPIIKPLALKAVYEVRKKLPSIPLIGQGGIFSADDAIDFFAAGANAIALATAILTQPDIPKKIYNRLIEEGFYS